jgi:hypothetical protein
VAAHRALRSSCGARPQHPAAACSLARTLGRKARSHGTDIPLAAKSLLVARQTIPYAPSTALTLPTLFGPLPLRPLAMTFCRLLFVSLIAGALLLAFRNWLHTHLDVPLRLSTGFGAILLLMPVLGYASKAIDLLLSDRPPRARSDKRTPPE